MSSSAWREGTSRSAPKSCAAACCSAGGRRQPCTAERGRGRRDECLPRAIARRPAHRHGLRDGSDPGPRPTGRASRGTDGVRPTDPRPSALPRDPSRPPVAGGRRGR
ncbi:hypothetical protein TR51_05470 [Kitasatospora griseola]|uniref:Uncharacterized protein n=1 Tax=Kitasatospora griseola TaxID=2064 RepID=A0A0D0Q2U6_KITGR|nr:hypothetical protein TR51_05470 [Kitasatospora griseola]